MSDSHKYTGSLHVKSCIFYNFFDQFRCGMNASITLEKCHLSECRGNAVYCVNPKTMRVSSTTISKPMQTGVLVEWLSISH